MQNEFDIKISTGTIVRWSGKSRNPIVPAEVESRGKQIPITNIGKGAFEGYFSLHSISLPETITSIEDAAFCACDFFESVNLPENLKTIGSYAFSGDKMLKFGKFPTSLTKIGKCSFRDCYKLTDVVLPEGLTEIPECAFQNCKGLTSISLPNTLETIGAMAFDGCTQLGTVSIPDSVTYIEKNAFSNCPNAVFKVGEKNKNYVTVNGSLYSKDLKHHLRPCGCGRKAAGTDTRFYRNRFPVPMCPQCSFAPRRNLLSEGLLLRRNGRELCL